MCDLDRELNTPENSEETESNSKSKRKYEICTSLREKLESIPEALAYIGFLEKQIRKQRKKLKKFQAKFKKKITKEIGTQTEAVGDNIAQTEEPKSISEEIKEAAELAMKNSGFVYDEISGMYYDSKTGYYYSAEYGLYYEASSGTYLSYNPETDTYEFHSRVHIPQAVNKISSKKEHRQKKRSVDESKASKRIRLDDHQYETEEGECSLSSEDEEVVSDETNSDSSEISRQWPPCMRLIVEQSNSVKIKIGSLHVLTYEGGTLGREGDHAILLPDINISKCHLKFTFDKEKNYYQVTDMGSRNGTILNGKRISTSKQESEPLEVAHGSRIQVGSIVLLCHVHEGNTTCGHCEPGLIQATAAIKKPEPVPTLTKGEKHKSELKKLKKKFGVSSYDEPNTKLASGYTDRAQKRRETVGSQNPHEKTAVASVDECIPSQNKGFKMLSKMGWKEGESLGKDNQGIVAPIAVLRNPGTSGMGSKEIPKPENICDKNKKIIWKKTQERFKNISNNNIFEDSD